MARLYDTYIDLKPWEEGLPTELIPPIKHLRKIFDEHHWNYGQITQKLGYYWLHLDDPNPRNDINEYITLLEQLKRIVGSEATQRFVEHFKTPAPTAPAIIKAFYDIYLDGMTVSAIAIFIQFAAIGKAHQHQLSVPHLEWAHAQTKHMIRSHIRRIEGWMRNVCDKQIYDPQEDTDEQIFWRKWQAPEFVIMAPSRYKPYDPARIWERFDVEKSQELLKAFAEFYVIHLEYELDKVVGRAEVELAKQPQPTQPAPVPANAPVTESVIQNHKSTAVASSGRKPNPSRREVRKKATLAKHKKWQKAYQDLKKQHPDQSDRWYSIKISRMEVGRNNSPDTIRKHMKA